MRETAPASKRTLTIHSGDAGDLLCPLLGRVDSTPADTPALEMDKVQLIIRFQADHDLLVGNGFRVVLVDLSLGGSRIAILS